MRLENLPALLLQPLNSDFQAALRPPVYLEIRHLEIKVIRSAAVSPLPVTRRFLGDQLQLRILYLVVPQLLAVI